jgi:hypothetical protein
VDAGLFMGRPYVSACEEIDAEVAFRSRGTVSFDDTTETADLAYEARATFTIPASCAAALAPGADAAAFCANFDERLPASRQGGCAVADHLCRCDFEVRWTRQGTSSYSTFMDLAVRDQWGHWSYCVQGGRLLLAQDDGSPPFHYVAWWK